MEQSILALAGQPEKGKLSDPNTRIPDGKLMVWLVWGDDLCRLDQNTLIPLPSHSMYGIFGVFRSAVRFTRS